MAKLTETTMKYSYNDVMVKPAVISTIKHRAECNPFYENNTLPIFAAPMDCVVGIDNFETFEEHGIIPILPRTEKLIDRLEFATNGKWAAFSLQEFEAHFTKSDLFDKKTGEPIRALIDIANGHVAYLYELVRNAKKIYGDEIIIMVGNIANPETYRICVESQVDFCRVGIGGGCGCFDDGTLISMADGSKKEIENVNVGDNVITHDGSIGSVTSRTRFKTNSSKLKINGEITCTKDHKFYVVNKKDISKINENNLSKYGYWVEAEKLDKDKQMLVKLK